MDWKMFKVSDLFEAILSSGDNKINDLESGSIPLITSGETNNGIAGYVSSGDQKSQLFDGNMLTVDMFGNVFFQPIAFYAVSHGRINMLKSLSPKMQQKQLLFIASAIKKQTLGRYGFTYMLSSKRVKELSIDLPVTLDNQPDYDFMETFITAQEKLAIQRLSNFRKEQIELTKTII